VDEQILILIYRNLENKFEEGKMNGRDSVVCPKPRRAGLLNFAVNDHPSRAFRWHLR
jgi:hypothetical protein